MKYSEFLERKTVTVKQAGFDIPVEAISPVLFDFQRDLVRWALRKGRAAIFADTGMGKTFMQLEWARLTGLRVLIIAPLSVARQTVREARKLDLEVVYIRRQFDTEKYPETRLFITNYEMIEQMNFEQFGAVVLDESSILKSLDGKTRQRLTDLTASVPYKLCCTATPAPNDIAEIGNHAEYLGIKTAIEMKAEFFVHDDDGYRLKGHAETAFFKWLASWGMSVRKPSDIGPYSDDGYILPALSIVPLFVKVDYQPEGQLFFTDLGGITGRSDIRKSTTLDRCKSAAELVNASADQFIVWCGLDAEQEAIQKLIPDCVSVYGRHSPDEKAEMLEAFQDGKYRVLVTKIKIAGFGMNFQNAHNMAFVGLSDSFEAYYQGIRREYRFGQKDPVNVYIVLSELEDEIYQNVLRKEREANEMSKKLIENIQQFERAEIGGQADDAWEYKTDTVKGENFAMMLGDSCERLGEIESDTVGLSVYSPPFMSLYTYSPTERDLGNSKREEDFFTQYSFIMRELLRITKPGRLTCVHVAQVPAMLSRDGYIGLKDFRGQTIEAYKAAGWIHHGEVCIDKDPQAQAIRTKAKSLLFTQLRKDSSWSRPALSDFILIFRKPGENDQPIHPDISNDQWIEWARPIWYGINESDTLQYTTAREDKDERHIAPLQLATIERCVRLWSNPGDLICSPFAGIGSEGYVALKRHRRFVGCELKHSYWHVACRNLKEIEQQSELIDLFQYADLNAQENMV
jgi:superfamily II DNA or RNA helicase